MECPFCGAEVTGNEHEWGYENEILGRMPECYETQIVALQAQLADREERLALWRGIKQTIDMTKLRLNPYVYEALKAKGELAPQEETNAPKLGTGGR